MKKGFSFALLAYFLILPSFISAQSVDLLWEGETYTPPFFTGRPLWSMQSSVNVVAIPQGLGNPNTLNYKWSKNGTVLGSLSGIGKNSLRVFDNSLSKSAVIKVQIVSSAGDIAAESSVDISPQNPTVTVYENHPLYGFLFNTEVYSGYTIEKEATFTSFPFYLDEKDYQTGSIRYEWRTNAATPYIGRNITFRAPEGEEGTAKVSNLVSNGTKFLQKGQTDFIVKFDNND